MRNYEAYSATATIFSDPSNYYLCLLDHTSHYQYQRLGLRKEKTLAGHSQRIHTVPKMVSRDLAEEQSYLVLLQVKNAEIGLSIGNSHQELAHEIGG